MWRKVVLTAYSTKGPCMVRHAKHYATAGGIYCNCRSPQKLPEGQQKRWSKQKAHMKRDNQWSCLSSGCRHEETQTDLWEQVVLNVLVVRRIDHGDLDGQRRIWTVNTVNCSRNGQPRSSGIFIMNKHIRDGLWVIYIREGKWSANLGGLTLWWIWVTWQ